MGREAATKSSSKTSSYLMLSAIWYHLYSLRNVKNILGGVLLSVEFQTFACNFTKSNTPPWVFSTYFKLHKWYNIAQSVTYYYPYYPYIHECFEMFCSERRSHSLSKIHQKLMYALTFRGVFRTMSNI